MIPMFINIRVIDIIDILLVAALMYQIYYLIKGTAAFNIFIGIIGIYLLYIFVKMLQMKLLTSILGGVISGGAIALIIVFQQEIRRFLIFVGERYFGNIRFSIDTFLQHQENKTEKLRISSIQKACSNMSKSHTGALIVISGRSSLSGYAESGDILNANLSSRLLESIFNKYSPLHDGAVILNNNVIHAARCVLPFTKNIDLSPVYGMRHRAGLGISEQTDAYVVIVSEERGEISVANKGKLMGPLSDEELWHTLSKKFLEE